MVSAFATLYRVAVPSIPAVLDAARDGLEPLWAGQQRLALFLSLAVAPTQGTVPALFAASTNESLAVLALSGGGEAFAYGWNFGQGLELQLDLEILRPADSEPRAAPAKPNGLRVVCARTSPGAAAAMPAVDGAASAAPLLGATGAVSPACRRAAAAWAAAHPESAPSATDASDETSGAAAALGDAISRAASGAGALARQGVLSSLLHSISRLFVDDVTEDAALYGDDDASLSSSPPSARASARRSLVVFESTSPAAAGIARALVRGRPVVMHAALAWGGVVPDAGLAPASLNAGGELFGRRVAGAANFTRRFAPQQVLTSSATLVAPAAYVPARPLRFLWTDVLGLGATAEGVARILGVDAFAFYRAQQEQLQAASLAAGVAPAPPALSPPAAGALTPHWLGQLDVKMIMETAVLPRDEQQLPPRVRPYINRGVSQASGAPGYLPLLAANPVRPLRERYHSLNASSTVLPLLVRVAPVSIGTWQLLATMDASLSLQHEFGANERDTDDVIRLVAETPMWLLALTFVVSAIHILFDVLAIKSDISFWSNATSLRGISVRSLAIDLVSQLVISVYLHSEGSSLLVLVPQALGNLLILWKLLRACGVVWRRRFLVVPWPSIDARLAATATELGTQRFDAEALSYLAAVLAPLLAGFAFFQLLYVAHESWASWGLTTAVSVVYGCGFALMLPQLFINYKLRSVAHLPWAVLFYRFFNTVIDDLFSFIVKMPTMARIAVFRDDIVFVCYMAQRWSYPVDRTRPAEGFDGEEEVAAAATEKCERDN